MTGTEHITADDFRAMNASVFGTGKYVLDYGNKFAATIVTNNQVRISDGMCMNQGTQMGIELTDYEDIAISNGVSGLNRNDLIVMRYERNENTSIEKASLVAIKGTAGTTAADPSYNQGNILDGGDLLDDMPLFRVKIESLSIVAVEPLFKVLEKVADRFNSYLPISGGTMAGNIVTPAVDSKGLVPASPNCGQLGSSSNHYYRAYINNVYAANFYENNKKINTLYASYEEGTWTPNIMGGKLSSSSGEYKKIGKTVFFSAKIVLSESANLVGVLGLPFTVNTDNSSQGYYHLSLYNNSNYLGGICCYDNYMSATPMVCTNNLIGANSYKIYRLYGIYETN